MLQKLRLGRFSTDRSDPLELTFDIFFLLEWFLMGQKPTWQVQLIIFFLKWPLCSTLLDIDRIHDTQLLLWHDT